MNADRELAERARAGDADAFGELFVRHAGAVRAQLLGRVPAGGADDVVQEAFLIAWREMRSLRDPARFGAWVRRIAANLASAAARRRPAAAARAPSPAAADDLRDVAVREAVASLPDHYRIPIWLRYAEGLSGPEVAERLGVSHAALRVVLHRGTRILREKLRRALGPEGGRR
ncbi:MAG: RNA polymerase sigma factor [Planctomycetota bacterium]